MRKNDIEIMKRYIVKQIPRKEDKYNISISYKFAKNNNFNIGDEVNLTLSGLSKKFYINEIVDTVEEIYPTYNAYVRVDDYDFGYIYFLENDLNKLIKEYAPILKSLMSIDNKLAKNYENIINSTNLSPIDLNNIPDNYASTITNEIIIKNLPGYTEDDVLNKVKQYLDDKGITLYPYLLLLACIGVFMYPFYSSSSSVFCCRRSFLTKASFDKELL